MDVCIFRNLLSAKPQRTSLEKIVQIIKTSRLLEIHTTKARLFYATGNKEKGDFRKKNLLPAFAPAGWLLDGKGRVNLVDLTGLCFLDIDKLEAEQLKSAMEKLTQDEHVLLATRSVSGHGIHILIPYLLWREDPLSQYVLTPKRANQVYGSVFKATAARYRDLLQLKIDKSGENAERLCLVSFDNQAYYNHAAVPIVYRFEYQGAGKKPKRFLEYIEEE